MMAKLYKETQQIIISDLRVAQTTWARMKGLLGEKTLSDQQGLWIRSCQSVHTFFMKFAIDCVFVDSNMTVVAVVKNLKPGRVTGFFWQARDVIELAAGSIERLSLKTGDRLYVGD